jgi:hypothetical protein
MDANKEGSNGIRLRGTVTTRVRVLVYRYKTAKTNESDKNLEQSRLLKTTYYTANTK